MDAEPSGSRQDIINKFKEICAVNNEIAETALASNNWNLEAALRVFLDGEDNVPDPLNQNAENVVNRDSDRLNESDSSMSVVVNTPNPGILDWLASFAMAPFQFAAWSLRFLFYFFYSLFGGPPLAVADPKEEVIQFVREFNEKYDAENVIPWLKTSYHTAVNESRRQICYLLVYVHNPTHRRADDFARNYLMSTQFLSFIHQNNCLIWGASIRSSEGYKVCMALHDFNYPFVAMLCAADGRATCIFRMSGEYSLTSLVNGLRGEAFANQPMLDRMHQERAQRELNSQLRREQEADYERALAADRARMQERKRVESEKIESQKREEEQRRQEQQDQADLEKLREAVLNSLPSEPASNDKDIIRVAVRFPDGVKLERRFNLNDSLELLFNVVFSRQNCPKDFSLLSSYPRKELYCAPEWYRRFSTSDAFEDNMSQTFRDAGFEGSLAILVRDNEA